MHKLQFASLLITFVWSSAWWQNCVRAFNVYSRLTRTLNMSSDKNWYVNMVRIEENLTVCAVHMYFLQLLHVEDVQCPGNGFTLYIYI